MINNSNNSIAGTVNSAIYISDSGVNLGWTYGLNCNDAQMSYEIIGQNGETWTNASDGYWDASGIIRGTVDATGGATVSNFIIAVGDSVTVVDGVITEIKHP
jgi:hypothetical protein